MQYLNAQQKQVDLKAYRNRSAEESDCSTLVRNDTVVCIDNKPIIVYIGNAIKDSSEMFQSLSSIKYETSTRTNGLVTASRIFGYAPRNNIRNLPCRATSLALDSMRQNETLKRYSALAAYHYNQYNRELADQHQKMTEENVLPTYQMSGSMFTSGIVNYNNPLKYHFDSGNYIGVWSSMFCFKHDVVGGHLACPEIDIAFECGNGSLIMFDGQSLLHGVTPIKKLTKTASRYTVVYYSLRAMWSCESPQGEVESLRARRQSVELSRMTKH